MKIGKEVRRVRVVPLREAPQPTREPAPQPVPERRPEPVKEPA